MGDDGGLAVEPRSPSAPAKPSVPAPQATPTSGTRSADVAGAASPPAVLDMAAAGRAGPVQAGGGPGSTPASAAAVSSPAASSAAGELTQLDSDDPATRATAVQNLAERRDERGWRLLLLAQQSRFADVRAAATALSLRKLGVDPPTWRSAP